MNQLTYYKVTYRVSASGRIATCEMTERQLKGCTWEIVEAIPISN